MIVDLAVTFGVGLAAGAGLTFWGGRKVAWHFWRAMREIKEERDLAHHGQAILLSGVTEARWLAAAARGARTPGEMRRELDRVREALKAADEEFTEALDFDEDHPIHTLTPTED